MIRLTKNELAFLSSAYSSPTALSPFGNITGKPRGDEYSSLSKKGIIVNETYSEEAAKLLLIIEKATTKSNVLISNKNRRFRMQVLGLDGDFISVGYRGGEMIADTFKEFDYDSLNEFFPVSKTRSCDVSVTLDPDAFAVLLAAIDHFRRNALLAASEIKTSDVMIPLDILGDIKPWDNGLYTRVCKRNALPTPRPENLNSLVKELLRQGCIERTREGIHLNDSFAMLARNLPLLSGEVVLQSDQIIMDSKVIRESQFYLLGGVHDIVGIKFDGSRYRLFTTTGIELRHQIERTMTASFLSEYYYVEPEKPKKVEKPVIQPEKPIPEETKPVLVDDEKLDKAFPMSGKRREAQRRTPSFTFASPDDESGYPSDSMIDEVWRKTGSNKVPAATALADKPMVDDISPIMQRRPAQSRPASNRTMSSGRPVSPTPTARQMPAIDIPLSEPIIDSRPDSFASAQTVPVMQPSIPVRNTNATICSTCGAPILNGDRFCRACGALAPDASKKICINCGSVADRRDSFCPKCGAKLDA